MPTAASKTPFLTLHVVATGCSGRTMEPRPPITRAGVTE